MSLGTHPYSLGDEREHLEQLPGGFWLQIQKGNPTSSISVGDSMLSHDKSDCKVEQRLPSYFSPSDVDLRMVPIRRFTAVVPRW